MPRNWMSTPESTRRMMVSLVVVEIEPSKASANLTNIIAGLRASHQRMPRRNSCAPRRTSSTAKSCHTSWPSSSRVYSIPPCAWAVHSVHAISIGVHSSVISMSEIVGYLKFPSTPSEFRFSLVMRLCL
ncbi:hypothetical protein F5Y06DRAFT_201746 [Hypoxylon sp. FL0890]|nr:hypothetical protein F5Y06DRAFT_201746 [Hypoxylon sp. FL0890]